MNVSVVKDKVMVQITEEQFNDFMDNQIWIDSLEEAGVDNWEGYDYARGLYQEKVNLK